MSADVSDFDRARDAWTCVWCRALCTGFHECSLRPPIYYTTVHRALTTGQSLAFHIERSSGPELDAIAAWYGINRLQTWQATVPHVPKTILRREKYEMERVIESDESLRARIRYTAEQEHGA